MTGVQTCALPISLLRTTGPQYLFPPPNTADPALTFFRQPTRYTGGTQGEKAGESERERGRGGRGETKEAGLGTGTEEASYYQKPN